MMCVITALGGNQKLHIVVLNGIQHKIKVKQWKALPLLYIILLQPSSLFHFKFNFKTVNSLDILEDSLD